MDFKNISSDVKKLSVITEGWCKRGVADEIERALVLDKLKQLYERVMFMETEEEDSAGAEAEPEVEVEFLFPDETCVEPLSDTEPAAEEPNSDSEPQESRVIEEGNVVAQPADSVETDPAGCVAVEASDETDAADTAVPASEETVTEDPRREETRSRSDFPRFNEQSLFDLDQIPVRRTSRDILLSLYSDEEEEVPAVAKSGRDPMETLPEPESVVRDEASGPREWESAGPSESEVGALGNEHEERQEGAAEPAPVSSEDPEVLPERPEVTDGGIDRSEPGPDAGETAENVIAPEPVADDEEEPFIDLEVAHDAVDDFDPGSNPENEPEYYPDDDDEDFNIIEISEDEDEEEHAAVLGDVMMENSAPALGDTFHAARTVENGPVSSLKGSIGLNDKFMIIRTLFGGDADLYEHTIDDLEEFTDLDEALLYLHDNFRWKPDNEGVNMLVGLLMRKLS